MHLEELRLQTRSGWERQTWVVNLNGKESRVVNPHGQEGGASRSTATECCGRGEDVTYAETPAADLASEYPAAELCGDFTLATFAARLDSLERRDLPDPDYRRWALESAALDLALQQNELTLAAACGRTRQPVDFVLSMGLGPDADVAPLIAWRKRAPFRFKLDAATHWSDELLNQLAALKAVDVIDLKGYYSGTPVDTPADAGLYQRVIEALPGAVIEDAMINDHTHGLLEPQLERLSWDAPIHSVADMEALPWTPRWINIKPSRFGSLERLSQAYAWCERQQVRMYGGGQFELGPGRRQVQLLASLFHPQGPNDVAPIYFHDAPAGGADAPLSPLTVTAFKHACGAVDDRPH